MTYSYGRSLRGYIPINSVPISPVGNQQSPAEAALDPTDNTANPAITSGD